MSFKLIAIRPLDKADSVFLKNLTAGHFYKFSSKYNFENIGSKAIIKSVNMEPLNLYDKKIIHNDGASKILRVNVSAIVGKNGSGKSSLMELLYVAFYKISRITNIIDLDEQSIETVDNLMLSSSLRATAVLLEDKVVRGVANELYDLELKHKYVSLSIMLSQLIEHEKKIDYDFNTDNINVEIYYEVDNNLFLLKLTENECTLVSFKTADSLLSPYAEETLTSKEQLKDLSHIFFYNLIVNYSLYGLNSNESGMWIEKLFHKNDSYQTPIVLNPYRNEGSININNENYLVRSRLLALIFAKDINNKTVAAGKEIKMVKLSYIDKGLTDGSVYIEHFTEVFFPKLYTYFYTSPINGKMIDLDSIDLSAFKFKEGKLYEKTLEYILKKIDNIVERYPTFQKYMATKDEEFINYELENALIRDLYQDRSHITLKIKQAINFYHYQDYVNDEILVNEKIFLVNVLEEKINSYLQEDAFVDLIEFIPPSFFKIELYFDETVQSSFSNLSSGEKQRIYSLNSIVYHIRNLLSVNKNHEKNKLIVYCNLNIILDEIELYYHPELQRTFLNDLLEYIHKIDFENRYFDCIPNLNIIFITHSPFILSDIPKQNILFLDLDNGLRSVSRLEKKQTFAANIHEMLTSGFFMKQTKGEFALLKMKKILQLHHVVLSLRKTDERWNYLKVIYENNKNLLNQVVHLIGEDYLRNIFENHIDEIEVKLYANIDAEILKTRRILQELERSKDEQNTIS